MKKGIKLALCALSAAVIAGNVAMFTACGGEGKKDTILITGSTSVEAVMTPLAAEYEKDHNVRINITANGSGVGIKDTLEGRNDFGMSSRDLSEDEKKSLNGDYLCRDGIAVVVKKGSAVEKADNDQLFALYTAGTPFEDNGVMISVPVGREGSSGTREAFDENIKNAEGKSIKELKCGYWDNANPCSSTGLLISAVSGNANAVGYASLGSYLANTDTLKALKVKGYEQTEYVEATTANVLNGSYKLQRPFVLVTKKDKEMSAAAKAFYDWLLTDDAAKQIISTKGYVLLDK